MNETAEELLRATEDTLRRRGVDDLNLREITGLAGANVAAVNYHFGGKTGLLYAVVERRLTPLHTERLRRLSELLDAAGEEPPSLEKIVDALIDPLFDVLAEMGDLAPTLMELALRLLSHPPERARRTDASRALTLASVLRQFDRAIGRALPALDARERWQRLTFVTGLLFQAAMIEPFLRELDSDFSFGDELVAVRDSMKRFALGGLTAAPPSPKRRRASSRRRT